MSSMITTATMTPMMSSVIPPLLALSPA
jgi:hypothetical protein